MTPMEAPSPRPAPISDDVASLAAPKPWGLKWRSSVWFVTSVVGVGIVTDLLVYSIIVPVLPFQLEHLGYHGVSGLVGWLLFAYSAGLVLSTPPIAYFSEHYNLRRAPLIGGLIVLVGAQILLMEAPKYWVMVIARIIQGISSSMVWVVGLALLCDTVPEKHAGRQLGFAVSGQTIGFLVGPPVSGALYDKFGFRAPFIFGIIITLVDLVGRLLIIERKTAMLWGIDPAAVSEDIEVPTSDIVDTSDGRSYGAVEREKSDAATTNTSKPADAIQIMYAEPVPQETSPGPPQDVAIVPRISPITILLRMLGSSRACAVFVCALCYGIVMTSQEPVLPLHLQKVWNLNSSKVGLVYIAAVVPGVFSSVLSGWLADRAGAARVAAMSLFLAVPWMVLLIIQSSLALFIVVFGIMNFFLAGALSPVTAELAAVTKEMDGVGYAHVYGAFNLAFGVGSALGPIIGGQIYDHISGGWTAICLLGGGLIVFDAVLILAYFGKTPVLKEMWRKHRSSLPV